MILSRYKNFLLPLVSLCIFVAFIHYWEKGDWERGDLQESTNVLLKYTDTANAYTLSYPSDWSVEIPDWCCGAKEPDWKKESRSIKLMPTSKSNKNIYIQVQEYTRNDGTTYNSFDQVWAEKKTDQFNHYEKKKINGHDAIYDFLDFTGPDGVESYKQHTYIIQGPTKIVSLVFGENYRHDWNKESNFDAQQYLPVFEQVVRSTIFKQ